LADRVGIAAMRSEVIGEGGYGGGIVALCSEHDAGLVDVDKQSDVVLAAPGGGFIDREPGHARRIGRRPRLVDIMVNDTP
jgi:hypothetical protein